MIKIKRDTIKSLAVHAKDVGSTEVQIGLLTRGKPTDVLSILSFIKGFHYLPSKGSIVVQQSWLQRWKIS